MSDMAHNLERRESNDVMNLDYKYEVRCLKCHAATSDIWSIRRIMDSSVRPIAALTDQIYKNLEDIMVLSPCIK